MEEGFDYGWVTSFIQQQITFLSYLPVIIVPPKTRLPLINRANIQVVKVLFCFSRLGFKLTPHWFIHLRIDSENMDPNTSWRSSKLQVAVIQTVSGTFTEIPLKFSFSLAGQRGGRNLSQLFWTGQRSCQCKTCRNHPLGNSFPFTVLSHKRALQSVTKSTDTHAKCPHAFKCWRGGG